MDEIVKAALKKWPNVPDCYGWLALDARGDWYMRDDATQAAGPFPQVKGSRITHDKLKDFIERNYERNAQGAWFFQNGPQRVYVQLEATPLVLGVHRRLAAPASQEDRTPQAAGAATGVRFEVGTHTGLNGLHVKSAWLDEHGRLFLDTVAGFGVVRSLDMDAAADAIEAGLWQAQEMPFADMPARFGYVLDPRPDASAS